MEDAGVNDIADLTEGHIFGLRDGFHNGLMQVLGYGGEIACAMINFPQPVQLLAR